MGKHRAAAILGGAFAALSFAAPGAGAVTTADDGASIAKRPVVAARAHEGVPFTGFDLLLIAGGGGLVLGAGEALRRAAANRA